MASSSFTPSRTSRRGLHSEISDDEASDERDQEPRPNGPERRSGNGLTAIFATETGIDERALSECKM